MNNFIYLDAAASYLKSDAVIEEQSDFLRNKYANAGRGVCGRASNVDKMVADVRKKIAMRMNTNVYNIVFTSGATDAINRIVRMLNISSDMTVAVSDLDHHSARLPFQMTAANIVQCPLDDKLNIDTWRALEKIYKEGKAKAIGVSNFLKHHLEIILNNCDIVPAVNQIEFHPGLIRKETIDFCKEKNIVLEAWAPLGKGKMLSNETLLSIAEKYNKSVAQLCLKWCLQNEVIPLPKSENMERMKQNLDLFDFQISEEDMNIISSMEFFSGSDMHPDTFN